MTRVAVLSDIHFGQLARTDYYAAPGEKIKDYGSGDMPLGDGLFPCLYHTRKTVEKQHISCFFEIFDNIFNCQGAYIKRALIELLF